MNPPLLPRALIAAFAAEDHYECLVGDLNEEYAQHVAERGRRDADCWYWSQTIRSFPSLLVSPAPRRSIFAQVKAGVAIVATLCAMLIVGAIVNGALDGLANGRASLWLHFLASWITVLFAGYALGIVCRNRDARIAIAASVIFVACFAIPSALRLSGPLYPAAWLLLLGTIPTMTLGASLSFTIRRLLSA